MYRYMYMYMYVYMRMYAHACIGVYVCMLRMSTVSFHNFKSQNFKLSVSNPKSKHVAYLSVLSQISNCQSLGSKNKHEILKNDRTSIPAFPRPRSLQIRVEHLKKTAE